MPRQRMRRVGKMKGTRLTVIKYSHTVNKKSIYLFRCDCGNEKKLRMDHVQQGEIVSCGCRQAEARIENLEKTKDIRPALISEGKQGKEPANKGKFAIYQYPGSKLDKGKVCYVDDAELSQIYHGTMDDPTQV